MAKYLDDETNIPEDYIIVAFSMIMIVVAKAGSLWNVSLALGYLLL